MSKKRMKVKPVQPGVEVDVIIEPKTTRVVRGIIVSRKRGEFATDTEDVQPKEAWEITNWREVDMSMNLKAKIPNYPDGGA